MAEFFNNYFLWRDPLFVAAFSGLICGFFGVYVVLKRMVFVSAALTQVSGFGVVFIFYLQSLFLYSFIGSLDPFLFSIIITILVAVFFSIKKEFYPISMEGIIGFIFIVSSSLIIIFSDMVGVGNHELNNIIFGSAVVVDSIDVLLIPILSVVALIINIVLYKDFIFVAYDQESAKLYNYPIGLINFIFFVLLALVIAITTRALGALTVFSLIVLPALSAMNFSASLKVIFIISSALGLISALFGYFFSFVYSMPTGASMAFTASIIFIFSIILRKLNFLILKKHLL